MSGSTPTAPSAPTKTWPRCSQEIRRLKPAAVIVDSADASEAYLTTLRQTGVLVMSLDTQAAARFPSRLVVNPLLGPSKEAYAYTPGTQLLLGAPLRHCSPGDPPHSPDPCS